MPETASLRLAFRVAVLRRLAGALLLAVLLLALAAGPVRAAATEAFGDIVVTVRNEPKETATHGYSEYVIVVTNKSSERIHHVELTIPKESFSRGGGDSLRSITREIEIGPGATEFVSIWQPDRPGLFGNGLGVRIDGRMQEQAVQINLAGGSGSSYAYHPTRGGRMMATTKSTAPGMSMFGGSLVLVSPGARKTFDPMGRFQPAYADDPVGRWSNRNWLGYTRYDGIVLTREEWDGLAGGTAEAQAVRVVLCQYTEGGGVLVILGQGALAIPASWKRSPTQGTGAAIYFAAFGQCIQTDQRDSTSFGEVWDQLNRSWSETSRPFQSNRSLSDANKNLPIVDDIGVPVRGLFVLMVVFALVIGPLNIWLLSRWKRRIWLLWTVPAISLVTCVAVFAYMIVAEGWQGRVKVTSFTVLDEKEQRATTLGRVACYSPLTPGSGLHFHLATEITAQGLNDMHSSGSSCSLDWTRDQHLRSGWVSARIPAHFQLRKSEPRRERVTFDRKELKATNGLGVEIKTFWLMDETGRVLTATNIGPGQQVALKPGKLPALPAAPAQPAPPPGGPGLPPGMPGGPPGPPRLPPGMRGVPPGPQPVPAPASREEALRQLYANSEWATLTPVLSKAPQRVLVPGSYLAVVESSPFLEPGLDGAPRLATDSVVLGLMAEGKLE
jgi:hypothetical protein